MVVPQANTLTKLNITFSGCGFLGIYHVGVASALRDRAPRLLERIENFGGASAGALVAGSLLCGLSLEESCQFTLQLAERAHKLSIGPFHPRFQLTKTIKKVFNKMVPKDAYKRCSGKLHVSLTRCSDWQNVVVSEFNSNEDLIDALVASAHVPFYSGIMPPKFRGVYHVDGGISNNLPQHFDGETITVTPWSGESDICPQDDSNSFNHIMFTNTSIRFSAQNFYRICRAFFPPNGDVLGEMCKQGYRDTIRYLEIHYPEYLIRSERSCRCSLVPEVTAEPDVQLDETNAPDVFEEGHAEGQAEGQVVALIANTTEEKCGECHLHSVLEVTKVDVQIAEQEYWSCYVIKILGNLIIRPCVLTVSTIAQMAECIILKLNSKVHTGVDFLDFLLHTINEAIVHYEIYQNIHSCTDSCSHEAQIYRSSSIQFESSSVLTDIEAQRDEDEVSDEDYETACSESSYATCQSSDCDDDLLETRSSSSSDTVVEEVFTDADIHSLMPDLVKPYPLGSKGRWDDQVSKIMQSYPTA